MGDERNEVSGRLYLAVKELVMDGFRPGEVLRSVCDIMKSQGRRIFLAFVDASKAYDIVWREGLWMKMRVQGSGRICHCMQKQASVLLGGECSRWFEVEAGLRQGCPWSPIL